MSTGDANRAWLEAHKDHYLHTTWGLLHGHTREFAETNCETTAWRLAEEFSGQPLDEWRCEEFPPGTTPTLDAPLCVVEMDDHWFVVRDGVVYQSFFRKFMLRQERLTDVQRHALQCRDVDMFVWGTSTTEPATCVQHELRCYTPSPSRPNQNKRVATQSK